ncbi:MAG: hypothetical protein U1F44_04335 [Coriobacteriia bacterium]|nr:hypothetical protein [Coriobacteriia bacterium]
MSRNSNIDPTLAAAVFGFQQSGSIAGGVAFGLVMTRRSTYVTPIGRELKQARETAARFKLSEDLAVFVPRKLGYFTSKQQKQLYHSAIIGLKQMDALPAEERAKAIEDLKMLLGV